MKVGVLKETAPGERRVALVPEMAARLRGAGLDVLVQSGAGEGAWFADSAYAGAGAAIVARDELLASADLVVGIDRPDHAALAALRPGQALLGMLNPLVDPAFAARMAERGVTAISLDGLPRTLPRAQGMDALTSQANVAGYKAALVAAAAFGRFFPLLITAAGTARPAKVLVLGTGVAGLQAIGTARRLGAVVSAYDVRPETKTEAESLGATFIELTSVGPAAGEGGYARALTAEERQAQQAELASYIGRHDVVITTAQVPGRRPPELVTGEAIKAMAAGSVIVDMGAGPLGGNVAGSVPDQTIVTENGVTVIGAGGLAATVPAAASAAFARNVTALVLHMVADGELVIDLSDDIQAGVVITHDGAVVQPAAAALLGGTAAEGAAGGPAPAPADGPEAGPGGPEAGPGGPESGPAGGPESGPADGPAPAPADSPAGGPESGPAGGPAPAPADSPAGGPEAGPGGSLGPGSAGEPRGGYAQ